MRIRLGYVSIANAIDDTSSASMTYKNFSTLDNKDALNKLDKIINSNLDALYEILKYNISNNITFYRMTSRLFPLSTHENVNIDISKYEKKLKEIGKIINENKIRVGTHPDQFCILNSTKKEIIEKSIKILEEHVKIFELMGYYGGYIVIHVGSGENGKEEALKRFEQTYENIPYKIKKYLILENDDRIFNMVDTLKLCENLNIPMVFDYHHYICNNDGENYKEYLLRIANTWKNKKIKMHFSTPKNSKNIRSHNDYINIDTFVSFIESLKVINKDIDIMLECKMKDDALFRLVRQLKYRGYKFENDTIFII